MTLDGHLLLSHPAESWPACTPPVCVCVPPFMLNCMCAVTVIQCLTVVIYAYMDMNNRVGYCLLETGMLDEKTGCLVSLICTCRT